MIDGVRAPSSPPVLTITATSNTRSASAAAKAKSGRKARPKETPTAAAGAGAGVSAAVAAAARATDVVAAVKGVHTAAGSGPDALAPPPSAGAPQANTPGVATPEARFAEREPEAGLADERDVAAFGGASTGSTVEHPVVSDGSDGTDSTAPGARRPPNRRGCRGSRGGRKKKQNVLYRHPHAVHMQGMWHVAPHSPHAPYAPLSPPMPLPYPGWQHMQPMWQYAPPPGPLGWVPMDDATYYCMQAAAAYVPPPFPSPPLSPAAVGMAFAAPAAPAAPTSPAYGSTTYVPPGAATLSPHAAEYHPKSAQNQTATGFDKARRQPPVASYAAASTAAAAGPRESGDVVAVVDQAPPGPAKAPASAEEEGMSQIYRLLRTLRCRTRFRHKTHAFVVVVVVVVGQVPRHPETNVLCGAQTPLVHSRCSPSSETM